MKETFVIGDVHGCFYTLQTLLAILPENAEVIMTGDLCDRGRFSCEVIDLVISRNIQMVLGNHDLYMISELEKCLADPSHYPRWLSDPSFCGGPTVVSYQGRETIARNHIEWLQLQPSFIEKGRFFITHGFGLPYYLRRRYRSGQEALVRNRINSPFKHDWELGWEKYPVINIFGHESGREVRRNENWICIDTGCGFEHTLTAISLATLETITIPVDPLDFSSLVKI